MSLHEKNATLLAQAIKETDADHIFIGDTDHKYANELLRTFC